MKKVILAIIALVSVIVGMLLMISSTLNGVSADVNFVDGEKPSYWYGTDNPQAIVNTTDSKLIPPPVPTIINRVSH